MTRRFALTWDYRCPYGRIAHDHVVTGLRAGADWDVEFLPFCLGQSHVEEGMPDVWDAPETDSGILALQVGIAVRDNQPHAFVDVHHALYEFKHARGGDLRSRDALSAVVTGCGLDADRVFAEVDSGRPLATIADEHTRYANSHQVWGVPVFVDDVIAVYVRLLYRAEADEALAVHTDERILDLIEWPSLNEFKHTSVPR
ncbi:MAG: protein-disulfide isomerase [Ilumatobacteraceae bacterium]